MTRSTTAAALFLAACFPFVAGDSRLPAQKKADQPPHGQDTVPGPPLSPAEAIRKMQVPDGFSVELVAAEPDLVNPVAMTFDERGRIWITESLEYPRRDAGPGRDRVKVLESTRGDGRYDKITVFAEGLNIPSGIAVGHGGVWVANSPDILFYREGPDGKAVGKPEVVVTGFGRTDTHELPNSLTWGPDGWLYGLNGVFNHSRVRHQGKEFVFTCALFRIHPRTREFQLFAEGTSNPWGIAWDTEGSAFVSACVIDHLWHLTETGYYHRQGGPYPPFTWKIESIVQHKHQKAAYCGLHFFDSDAYPPEYRDKLYMGNIHGGCINCDELTRAGSTYLARPRPDFLTANDQWFMPVAQKTGPDGCLYILDWYDRYHCYQDAGRDPKGIDRERGRLYRVRYKDSPPAGRFDLAKESDDQLIQRLHSPNVYFRDLAQRLLGERNTPVIRAKLQQLVLDEKQPRKARMHGLWALVGSGALPENFLLSLLEHEDPGFRAWGVRAAGNSGKVGPEVRDKVESLAKDESPDVLLQVAVAARKIEGLRPEALFVQVLASCGDDPLIPHIVWQNLHPLLEGDGFEALVAHLKRDSLPKGSNLARLMPRVFERLLAPGADPKGAALLLQALLGNDEADPDVARQCLATLTGKIQTGEITGTAPARWVARLRPVLVRLLGGKPDDPLYWEAALLAATLRDPAGVDIVRTRFTSQEQPEAIRLQALAALVAAKDGSVLEVAGPLLADTKAFSLGFRREALAALGRLDDARVGEVVLAHFPRMEPDFQPRAVELLTQRTSWSKQLLKAVAEKKVPAGALNVNHVRKLLASKDADILRQVKQQWGTLREDRNPEREKVVADMKKLLAGKKGNPTAGQVVFKTVCAQCHLIYGEGQDVGPDLTSNGRNDYDQLLSNVFDPSLIIGAAYQATTIATTQGRILTGLVVEDSAQRVLLKTQGGKLETVPRGEIDEMKVSKVSLMPEGIEKQLKEQEVIDLFAFLTLDKLPGDPTARKIPGAPK
jgi:putative membrane-bound dehydrogenase-like protein